MSQGSNLEDSVKFLNEANDRLSESISQGEKLIGTGNVNVDNDLRGLIDKAKKGASLEDLKGMVNRINKMYGQRSSNS